MISTGIFLANVDIKSTLTDKHIYWASFLRLILFPLFTLCLMKVLGVHNWMSCLLYTSVLDALYDTDHLMEVSVVGFDDSSIARVFRPQITTVSQPRFEMGKTAMKLLREKIVNINSPNIRKTVEHKLVIRDTTRNGRAW